MKTVENSLENEIVDRLVQELSPDRIILFGSRSRENHSSESDYDLLIIKGGTDRIREETRKARLAVADLPASFDIVVATPSQIERYGRSTGLIYRTALEEGKTWYVNDHEADAS